MHDSNNPVLVAFEKYKKSVFEKDVEAFTSLYDENVSVFDMWGDWSLKGVKSWKQMAEGWFGSLGDEKVQVEWENAETKVASSMAYGSATFEYTAIDRDGKKMRSLQNRFTCVLSLRNGEWKIIHEHTSGPVDHATMKVLLSPKKN